MSIIIWRDAKKACQTWDKWCDPPKNFIKWFKKSSTTTAKFLKKVAMKMISLIGKSLNNRVMNFYIHNHHHQVLTIYICSYTLVVVWGVQKMNCRVLKLDFISSSEVTVMIRDSVGGTFWTFVSTLVNNKHGFSHLINWHKCFAKV